MIDTILILVLKESLSRVLITHVTVKNDSLTVLWLKYKRIPEIHLQTQKASTFHHLCTPHLILSFVCSVLLLQREMNPQMSRDVTNVAPCSENNNTNHLTLS